MANCPYCNKPVEAQAPECRCGFPNGGDRGEKLGFLQMKSIPIKAEMESAAKGIRWSRTALIVAAGVALLNTVLLLSGVFKTTASEHLTDAVIMTSMLAVTFGVLALLLKKSPLPISIAGVLLSFMFFRTSAVGLALIAMLGYGVWCAWLYSKANRRYDRLQRAMAEYSENSAAD